MEKDFTGSTTYGEYAVERMFRMADELHDIYGNVYYTPFTLQYVDEDGEVWVDGEFY